MLSNIVLDNPVKMRVCPIPAIVLLLAWSATSSKPPKDLDNLENLYEELADIYTHYLTKRQNTLNPKTWKTWLRPEDISSRKPIGDFLAIIFCFLPSFMTL